MVQATERYGESERINKRRTTATPLETALVVADAAVEVELGVDLVAVGVAETGTENVAVVDADVRGRGVERHFERY